MKSLRRKISKRRLPSNRRSSRPGVSRREYAELVVRLGSVELQAQRNRAELELHAQRLAQLQDQLAALKAAVLSAAVATDMPPLPIPPIPTVES